MKFITLLFLLYLEYLNESDLTSSIEIDYPKNENIVEFDPTCHVNLGCLEGNVTTIQAEGHILSTVPSSHKTGINAFIT